MHKRGSDQNHLYWHHRPTRRQFLRSATLLGLAAASTPLWLRQGVPSLSPTQALAADKILRLRLVTDITNIDPAFHPATADTQTLEAVNEGLVSYKPGTWEVVNVLAEKIEASPDGLRVDFKLREGIQFHHGYGELTAEDVKFSYERIINPELQSSYKQDWEALDHVEVTGKYTGTIILKEPFAPLWTSTLPIAGGLILSKKAVTEKGLDVYKTSPVGTGPYEFVEWVPNQKVVLRRFADYWGEQPEWDEIHELVIPEDSAAEVALQTDELDFGVISGGAVERVQADPDFTVIEIPTMDYHGLVMNVQHPKLQDINVRQAIRYAVDVQGIIDGAYDGKAVRACSIIAPGQLGYWAGAPCYERDVEKARSYMEKAGLKSLDVTLTVYNSEVERAVGEIIQASLAEVGINAEIITQDDATYWDGGFGETGLKERQLTYISWGTTNPDPTWSVMWFICDQVLQWNWMYWCDKEFDDLYYAALRELDPDKRNQLYIQLQQVWDKACNVVWTVHPIEYFAVRKGIMAGISPAGVPVLRGFRSA